MRSGASIPMVLGCAFLWHIHVLCSPPGKLIQMMSFGFLRRLHYIGMVDYIIDYWYPSSQPLVPLPISQRSGMRLKFKPFIHVLVPLNKHKLETAGAHQESCHLEEKILLSLRKV